MTNEELYRQYLSGDAEAFERLYLQMLSLIHILRWLLALTSATISSAVRLL